MPSHSEVHEHSEDSEAPTESPSRSGMTVAPSQEDRFVRFISGFIGGPLGDHAVNPPRRRFWTPLHIILLAGLVVFALSWLQKSPCAGGGWVNFEQYTQGCYTDIRALWGARHLNEGAVPYRDYGGTDDAMEYPVLTGWLMGILGQLAFRLGNIAGVDGGTLFYHFNALTLIGCGIAAICVLYMLRRNRPWDAMMLAVAPVMLVTATVNWDLFAVALVLPFFLYWQRGRPMVAGLFLGLAVAAKFYPLLFAGPLLILALRNRRVLPALKSIAVAALTWAAINAPVAALWPDSWRRFFELNSERPVDWGTSWYVLRHLTNWESLWDAEFVNDAYLVMFALACTGIAALGYLAPKAQGLLGEDAGPRLAQLCFLVVAAFLLFGKVWSQQYVLWLLPLAILARPKWGMFLVWQAAELFYFVAFYGKMLQVSPDWEGDGIPEWIFVTAASTRWLAVAAMSAFVVYEILNPRSDVVRFPRVLPSRAVPPPRRPETADPAPA